MPDTDKQEILARLDEGRMAVAEALAGVDDRMAQWKQTPEAWSIIECLEHLVMSEELLMAQLTMPLLPGSPVSNPAREKLILKHGVDRSARVESPEAALPCGCYRDLDDAFAGFASARAETVDWVIGQERDLHSWFTHHPLIPGPVSCYEMLLIMSVHPRRHAEQIKAIRLSIEQAQEPEHGR